VEFTSSEKKEIWDRMLALLDELQDINTYRIHEASPSTADEICDLEQLMESKEFQP
jgi:hypothetical protein